MSRKGSPSSDSCRLLGRIAVLGMVALLMAADDVSRDELRARRERIENMSQVDRNLLQEKFHTFQSLPEERQQAYREIQQTLDKAPDGHRLQTVLWNYDAWLRTLTPWQRAEIRAQKDSQARLEVVRRIKAEEDNEREGQISPDRPPRPRPDGTTAQPTLPSQRIGFSHHFLDREDLERVIDVVARQLSEEERSKLSDSPPERHVQVLLEAVNHAYGQDIRLAQRSWPPDPLLHDMIDAIQDKELREWLQDEDRSTDHHRMRMRMHLLSAIRKEAERELDRLLPQKEDIIQEHWRKLDKMTRDSMMTQGRRFNPDLFAWAYLEEQGNSYAKDLAQLRKLFYLQSRGARPEFGPRRQRRVRGENEFLGDRKSRESGRGPRELERGPDGPPDNDRGPDTEGPNGPPPPRQDAPPK